MEKLLQVFCNIYQLFDLPEIRSEQVVTSNQSQSKV